MVERIIKGCEPVFNGVKFNNLKEVINNTKEKYGDKTAFKFKDEKTKEMSYMTYNEYVDEINALGTALISIGLKDKRIVVISENRYEWEEAYLAIVCGTGIVVPLDKSLPENELVNLIERSEAEAIFYSSKYDNIMKKAKTEGIGKVNFYISMDLEEKTEDAYSQKELIKLGKDLIKNGARSFLDAKIDNENMAIMLFTSGTTAASKAVMLSHANVCTNIYDISSVFDINENDLFLSFLPLHHVFECTVGFLYPVSVGAGISFCEGIRHIADNVREFEVTAMISVPILYENIYKKLMQKIQKEGKMPKVKLGMKFGTLFKKVSGLDLRKKIFKEIHDALGGKVRIFVAGAAAFNPDAERGFNEIGIDTYQGYGLTETCPVIAAEHKTCTKYGSVGKILPSLEAKIIEPNEMGIGEIAVKGPSVMLGYFGKDKSDAFTEDGWFLTGDLGYFDKDEYLFITGRTKSVIVLKNGKNIYPEEIEALLNEIPGVKESFVFGRPDKDDEIDLKIGAKLVYDIDKIKAEYGTEDIEEIRKILWDKVKEINKTMPTYKYVKEMILSEEELIKTTTLKIKRFEEIKKVL